MKEKKSRIEDALHATRAAVEEGVAVPPLIPPPLLNHPVPGDFDNRRLPYCPSPA